MKLNKQNKDKLALLVGFLLILAVAMITFYRSHEVEDEVLIAELVEKREYEYVKISAKDLQQKMLTGKNIKIVDIRTRNNYIFEHIVDSVNIPLENLRDSVVDHDKNDMLVIVGNNETYYYDAMQIIEDKGYSQAFALSGGFLNWKKNTNQTISFGNPDQFEDQAKITYITADELKNLIDTNYPAYILDVRNKRTYIDGHIAGAVNIPLKELEARRMEIPADADIVVYGETELQGFQAGVRLYDLNFFAVSVFKEGLSVWTEKEFELVK